MLQRVYDNRSGGIRGRRQIIINIVIIAAVTEAFIGLIMRMVGARKRKGAIVVQI